MGEISKITAKISGEADEYEATVIAAAEKQAAEIMKSYAAEAEEKKKSAVERGKKSAASILAQGESSAAFIHRNALLQMKNALTDDVMKHAEERIVASSDEKMGAYYTGILMAASRDASIAAAGECEVAFNARDRKRYGDEFLRRATKNSAAMGRKITFKLSKQTAPVRNGFIIYCGDIEINCAIEKILESRRGEFEPQVTRILFDKK